MATRAHAEYCFDVLSARLNGQPLPEYTGEDADEEFPLFVTWNIIRPGGSTRLRGCIGSFTAMPLKQGLQEYALVSALKDRRFSPITLAELPKLECGVSLLTDFEDVYDPYDWELGTHGIYIHFEDPAAVQPPSLDSPASGSSANSTAESSSDSANPSVKTKLSSITASVKRKAHSSYRTHKTLSATYLPDVAPAQGWDKTETLDSAMRKAGYHGKITDAVRQAVRVTRYQSSKVEVDYSEWQESRQ